MTPLTDHAVVLRLSEFAETSQIVTLFGAEHGLLRLIAKGARRSTKTKFAAWLDLLEFGELGYLPPRGDAQLGILTDWRQQASFAGLRRELLRLYAGLYAAELVAGLTEEADPHPELFAALLELLRGLDSAAAAAPLVPWFQSELLRAIGYAPLLEQCVECGRPPPRGAPAFFSPSAGGLLCRDCEMHHVEKRHLAAALLADLAAARGTAADATTGASGSAAATFARAPAAWFELFDYHLTWLAGRRFKTAAQVHTLLAGAAAPHGN